MRPELAVVCDQLRTMGMEDVARWVEHPDAVRHLLDRARYAESNEGVYSLCCVDCGAALWEPHERTQLMDSPGKPWRDCLVAAAWRALGDPRGAADIETAHGEALRRETQLEPSLFGVNSDVSGYDLWRSENLTQENLTMGSILQAMDPARFR